MFALLNQFQNFYTMKKLFVPFFALVIAIMLTSCGSKELKQASLIPKDANLIIVLDQKAMEEKLKAGNFLFWIQ